MGISFRGVGKAILGTLLLFGPLTAGRAGELMIGDVLVGSTNGIVYQYRNGSHVGSLDTYAGTGGYVIGLCTTVDNSYLFAAVSRGGTSGNVYRFDGRGALQGIPAQAGSFVSLPFPPLACVVDRDGSVYVATKGYPAGSQPAKLNKYLANGSLAAAFEPQGIGQTQSMDLHADRCTLVYVSAGRLKRFDVCAGMQLTDLDQSALGAYCTALRLNRFGGTMVACGPKAYRLDSDWQVLNTYEASSCRLDQPSVSQYANFRSINSTPDEQKMWASLPVQLPHSPRLCSLEIESGRFVTFFDVDSQYSTAVFGERLAVSKGCRKMLGGWFMCLDFRRFPYLQVFRIAG